MITAYIKKAEEVGGIPFPKEVDCCFDAILPEEARDWLLSIMGDSGFVVPESKNNTITVGFFFKGSAQFLVNSWNERN